MKVHVVDVDAMLSAILEEDSPRALPVDQIFGQSVLVKAFAAALSEYKVGHINIVQGPVADIPLLGLCGCCSWATAGVGSRSPAIGVTAVSVAITFREGYTVLIILIAIAGMPLLRRPDKPKARSDPTRP